MQKLVRKWLGITDVLDESAKWNEELSKFSSQLTFLAAQDDKLCTENKRLRAFESQRMEWMAQKFDNVTPASPEFFDEMRKQMEARMDQTMNACDRMADEMKRARLALR